MTPSLHNTARRGEVVLDEHLATGCALRDMHCCEPIPPARVVWELLVLDVAELADQPLRLPRALAAVERLAREMSMPAAGVRRWAERGRSVNFGNAAS